MNNLQLAGLFRPAGQTGAAASAAQPDAGTWFQRHVRVRSALHERIGAQDKLQFFQQLSTLLSAGTPLLEALSIAATQSQSKKLQAVIHAVGARVAGGVTLHQALGDYPKLFHDQWLQVVRTGELSGKLNDVLASLTAHMQAARELRARVISAMIYPCILSVVAVLAIVVMLWKVVPTFADFFKEFGSKLPPITQSVIDMSEFLQAHGLVLLAGLLGAILGLRAWLRSERGRRLANQVVLTLPGIGPCLVQVCMERFASNLVLLLRSGLPLLEALSSIQCVFRGNAVYADALRRVQQRVAGGGSLAAALEETGLFTSMLTSMVRVGEESGQLSGVLDQVSDYYRKRVERLVERVTSMIEPVVILVMGVAVAVILTAIYLPMFQMSSGPR